MNFKVLCLIFLGIENISALSCFCGESPCEKIECCASGELTFDACGCCPVCAKAAQESCGGPWGISGRCVSGLNCLRKCECQTEETKENCIFPFNFGGKKYNSCTKDYSENGLPWCATAVYRNGTVIKNRWGDCSIGCPGTEFECDGHSLFNNDGICVNKRQVERRLKAKNALYQFDENFSQDNKKIKHCDTESQEQDKCQCAQVVDKEPQLGEGCTGEDGNGFCFLEFVNNPDNPSENCFPDAQFSKSHGKFWSNLACAPPPEPIPEPPTLPPRAPPFDDFVEISGTKTKLNGPPAPPLSGQRIISAPAPPKRNIN